MLPELVGFSILEELPPAASHRVFDAFADGSSESVRLLLFSPELSQRPEFRRAFKTDRAVLQMLQHQSIPRVLGTGEHDGALFLWTQQVDGQSLAERQASGRRFSTDDVIEIGWQLCSALQHAHNIGYPHGGLSDRCVLLSDSLQVSVSEFGLHRWLRAAQQHLPAEERGQVAITVSAMASRADVEQDLMELATLLARLHLPDGVQSTERPATAVMLDRVLTRATSVAEIAQRPVTAREFQGRLGEILIGGGDDSIPLVDERKQSLGSKRSIVVELFDLPGSGLPGSLPDDTSASPAWRTQILPIAVIAGFIILLLVLAGWLWSAANAAGA